MCSSLACTVIPIPFWNSPPPVVIDDFANPLDEMPVANGNSIPNFKKMIKIELEEYGRTVGIIGEPTQLRLAVDAISSLSSGSMHGPVYSKLEAARRREKAEKALLWENQDVF